MNAKEEETYSVHSQHGMLDEADLVVAFTIVANVTSRDVCTGIISSVVGLRL